MTLEEVHAIHHAALAFARLELSANEYQEQSKPGAGQRRLLATQAKHDLLKIVRDHDAIIYDTSQLQST